MVLFVTNVFLFLATLFSAIYICGFHCRFVDSSMLLTFRSGQSALSAVRDSSVLNIADETVRVSLLTSDWHEHIEDELALARSNTTAMYSATTNSLLGEDFSIPSMSFDMDGMLID